MPKHLIIQIPETCHQNWGAMQANIDGRYCQSCQKTVLDFTAMTNTQLVHYFQKHAEKTCGRFNDDQLNIAIAIPKKPLPWLKYFFTITLPAFLFSIKTSAQTYKNNTIEISINPTQNKQTIVEENKDSVIDLPTVKVESAITSRQGMFRMGDITRSITSNSCSKKIIVKNVNTNNEKTFLNNEISIYPNPTPKNGKLNITWQNAVNTNQFVEIYNANGNLMQQEMINTNFFIKTKNAGIWLKPMATGFYIIRVTDVKTGVKMSRTFLVD